jgi:ribonucleotide monophosphatase NagD (HAD superfamily)
MPAVPGSLIAGFGSLVDQYDGFILDQFGVMHNGVVALPGAKVCVRACLAEHEVVRVCA